jgi:hypothetical protein
MQPTRKKPRAADTPAVLADTLRAFGLYKRRGHRDKPSLLAAARGALPDEVCPRTGVTSSEAGEQRRWQLSPRQ